MAPWRGWPQKSVVRRAPSLFLPRASWKRRANTALAMSTPATPPRQPPYLRATRNLRCWWRNPPADCAGALTNGTTNNPRGQGSPARQRTVQARSRKLHRCRQIVARSGRTWQRRPIRCQQVHPASSAKARRFRPQRPLSTSGGVAPLPWQQRPLPLDEVPARRKPMTLVASCRR